MFTTRARKRQVQQPKEERNFALLPKHIQNQTQNRLKKIKKQSIANTKMGPKKFSTSNKERGCQFLTKPAMA
jgi:hypothetical protein